jgi:hypothetical protein
MEVRFGSVSSASIQPSDQVPQSSNSRLSVKHCSLNPEMKHPFWHSQSPYVMYVPMFHHRISIRAIKLLRFRFFQNVEQWLKRIWTYQGLANTMAAQKLIALVACEHVESSCNALASSRRSLSSIMNHIPRNAHVPFKDVRHHIKSLITLKSFILNIINKVSVLVQVLGRLWSATENVLTVNSPLWLSRDSAFDDIQFYIEMHLDLQYYPLPVPLDPSDDVRNRESNATAVRHCVSRLLLP